MQCTTTIGKYIKIQQKRCRVRVAQSKGLQFYQTRSNAIILYNNFPAVCIEKVAIGKSGEGLYSETYQSPSVPQRISRICIVDARTPQALTRERPSIILTSTVERTGKLVAIHQFESHPNERRSTTRRSTTKARVQSVQREIEGNDLQHGKHGVLEICEITPHTWANST